VPLGLALWVWLGDEVTLGVCEGVGEQIHLRAESCTPG